MFAPDTTNQQEESHMDMGQGDEECSSVYEEDIYGDFVLSPQGTATQRTSRRLKRTQTQQHTVLQVPVRPIRILPEILERICYFASQIALRKTICLVCKSWYFASAPFIRKKGRWMMGPQNAEDELLSRMVNIETLLFNFTVSSYGHPDRSPPYNHIEPAFGRFLRTITDPIEDVLPTLRPLHRPLSSDQYCNRSALYRKAFVSAQKAKVYGKSCLLDFPTTVEFLGVDLKRGLFQLVLPHLSHIRILKLRGLAGGVCNLAHILNQCLSLDTFLIDSPSYSDRLSFSFETSNSSVQSQLTSGSARHQQYPQLHCFSATAPRMTQQTVASLIKALPSLTYFKVHVSRLYGELPSSMDLAFLYKHAAENCPQLALVHISQDTGTPTDDPHIALVQQFFPQITGLHMYVNYNLRSWRPDLATFLFFSQLTHLEVSETGSRWKAFSLDMVLRAAPRLISLQAPHTCLIMNNGSTLQDLPTRYDNNGREMKNYRQSNAVKRKERLAQRIAKQVDKDDIRELPHPSLWLCQALRTADLQVYESPELFQYIVRQCPQLTDLTLRMNCLKMGQMDSTPEKKYLFKRSALYAEKTQKGVISQGRYAIQYCQSTVRQSDDVQILAGLEKLERLVLHVNDIPGELTIECFEWMSVRAVEPTSSPRRRGNTAIFREAYKHWPRMERFELHGPQRLVAKYASLWNQLREARPSIEYLLYYAPPF